MINNLKILNKSFNKAFFSFGLVILLSIIGLTYAEDFLVKPKSKNRKPTVSRLKEEIVEILSNILRQETRSIELKAQTQQLVFDRVEEIATQSKNSFFSKATRQELEACLAKLESFYTVQNKELREIEQRLVFFKKSCEIKVAK